MKQLTLPDARNGEGLVVRYHPPSGHFWINGDAARRETALEDEAGIFVFGVPATEQGMKLYHIAQPQLERLRDAPDVE